MCNDFLVEEFEWVLYKLGGKILTYAVIPNAQTSLALECFLRFSTSMSSGAQKRFVPFSPEVTCTIVRLVISMREQPKSQIIAFPMGETTILSYYVDHESFKAFGKDENASSSLL